jgi:hypothetical protein
VLNAIVVWQVEQARERARAADASLASGERWGPVHGIPMTVKESFNLAGLPSIHDEPRVGVVSAFALGTAADRGGTMTAASGWRSVTSL